MKTILCISIFVIVHAQCILFASSVPSLTKRQKRQLPCNHPLRLSLPEYFTHCDKTPCTYGSWSLWKRVPGQNFTSVSQSLCQTGKAYIEERFRPTTGSGCDQPVRETRRICEHKNKFLHINVLEQERIMIIMRSWLEMYLIPYRFTISRGVARYCIRTWRIRK
jgi:hypothetical protein